MAKLRTKAGIITLEYDSKAETIETEYNGIDEWVFKIIKTKSEMKPTLSSFASAKLDKIETNTIALEYKELEDIKPQDIIEYLKTKQDFEHDTIELQEHFLKRRVISRDERKLYFAFDKLIRKAKDLIAEEYHGTWEASATRKSYGGRHYANIYKLRKAEQRTNETIELINK